MKYKIQLKRLLGGPEFRLWAANLMATALNSQDIQRWAAAQDIVLVRGV
jgi:hypothetical protein